MSSISALRLSSIFIGLHSVIDGQLYKASFFMMINSLKKFKSLNET